jgi:hypothetical protein
MVEIKGKRGRKVAVNLTPDTKQAIEMLVKKRDDVGINQENKYLFAMPNKTSTTYIWGWECLRKYAVEANLEKPELITSTRLRKYIGTVSQVLDLNERELGWLARHMGHDVGIHKEYYRLHESTIELAKISKILSAVDEGAITDFSGKTLDDIELNLTSNLCQRSDERWRLFLSLFQIDFGINDL